MKRISFLRRYGVFFAVGALIETSRLICFTVILEGQSAQAANITSLVFRIVVAFILHTSITWRDRPGKFGVKFVKFAINQVITSVVKTALFPFWLLIIPCPLFDLMHLILKAFSGTVIFELLSRVIGCEFLSILTMDTVVYFTLGFVLHNKISFATKGEQER